MIILITIICAICFIYFNVIPGKGHQFIAWIALILTALSVIGIVAHDYNHYGMTEKTTITKQPLVSSATKKFPVLLYQPLGNGTEKIYLYKNADFEKKPKAIKTDKMIAKVIKTSKPSMEVKTTRYVYKNNTSRILFGIFGHNNELKKREYTFNVPKNWKVLSVKEAKNLQKQLLKKQKALLKMKAMQKAQSQSTK